MNRLSLGLAFVLGALGGLASCSGGSTVPSGDGGPRREGGASGSGSGSAPIKDAGRDATHPADSGGSGSGSDSGRDSGSDAALDAARDGLVDAGRADAEKDAHVDARLADARVDAGVDAGGSGPASCAVTPKAAGTSYCGASNESCCTSLDVQGGTYDRTYTNVGSGPTSTADPATISSFRLDKYLVTVARFRQFRNAVIPPDGGTPWVPPSGSGKHVHLNSGSGIASVTSPGAFEPGWLASDDANLVPTDTNLACTTGYSTWSPTPGDTDPLPINCVNWYEAYAFCIWDGGFLPSEAEWEYVAAGGANEQAYPWGATTPGTVNTYAIYSCHYPTGFGGCSGLESIAAVGSAPTGAALGGELDMAGDVYEWNLDLLGGYVSPCTDCGNVTAPVGTVNRVIRGGDFQDGPQFLLPAAREDETSTGRLDTAGMRCARVPTTG